MEALGTSRTIKCCLLGNLGWIPSATNLNKQKDQKAIEGMTIQNEILRSRQHCTMHFGKQVGPRAEILQDLDNMLLSDFFTDKKGDEQDK